MENIATKKRHPLPTDSTNILVTLARLMHPGSPAAPAFAFSADSLTTAIRIVKDDEGFSDDDLALATTCIMSNEDSPRYIFHSSPEACAPLSYGPTCIRGDCSSTSGESSSQASQVLRNSRTLCRVFNKMWYLSYDLACARLCCSGMRQVPCNFDYICLGVVETPLRAPTDCLKIFVVSYLHFTMEDRWSRRNENILLESEWAVPSASTHTR